MSVPYEPDVCFWPKCTSKPCAHIYVVSDRRDFDSSIPITNWQFRLLALVLIHWLIFIDKFYGVVLRWIDVNHLIDCFDDRILFKGHIFIKGFSTINRYRDFYGKLFQVPFVLTRLSIDFQIIKWLGFLNWLQTVF